MRTRQHDPCALLGESRDRLLREPRLADAGFTVDQRDDTGVADACECGGQRSQLTVTPYERQLACGLRLLDHPSLRQRAGADRVVELGRLAQRRHAELPVEHADALAILRERIAAPSRGGVELDQAAVGRLVQEVQRQPFTSSRDRVIHSARTGVCVDQPVK